MWKVYLRGQYLILEEVNGNRIIQRLAKNVEVRRASLSSKFYNFNDGLDTILEEELDNLRDVKGSAWADQDTFDTFIYANTGGDMAPLTPMLDASGGAVTLTSTDSARALSNDTPTNAVACTIMVQAPSGSTDSTKCLRYQINDTNPTQAPAGFFLGDGDIIQLNLQEMKNFSYISAFVGEAVTMWVQFYE